MYFIWYPISYAYVVWVVYINTHICARVFSVRRLRSLRVVFGVIEVSVVNSKFLESPSPKPFVFYSRWVFEISGVRFILKFYGFPLCLFFSHLWRFGYFRNSNFAKFLRFTFWMYLLVGTSIERRDL